MEMDGIEPRRIGQFLAELRREQGRTQEELAELLGVTGKTVSRWETGAYVPPADCLLKLSRLGSVSVDEILAGRRLETEELRQAAEEPPKKSVEPGSADRSQRLRAYRRQWARRHIGGLVVLVALVSAICAAGAAVGILVLGVILGAVLAAVCLGAGAYRMSSYAQRCVRKERGEQSE